MRITDNLKIFVTSISRRNFNKTTHLVIEDLTVQANATIAVAKEISADYIDLNRASTNYLNAIGATNASLYNLIPTDFTHLNVHGQTVFGNMVSLLLNSLWDKEKYEEWTTPNKTIATDIEQGIFIFP